MLFLPNTRLTLPTLGSMTCLGGIQVPESEAGQENEEEEEEMMEEEEEEEEEEGSLEVSGQGPESQDVRTLHGVGLVERTGSPAQC